MIRTTYKKKEYKEVKLIIAGGRDFTDAEGLLASFDDFMNDYENSQITVISGTARGADAIGEWIAEEYGIVLIRKPADWSMGMGAGYKRNEDMARIATHLLAAWNGISKGTKHMIDIARKKELVIRIHSY